MMPGSCNLQRCQILRLFPPFFVYLYPYTYTEPPPPKKKRREYFVLQEIEKKCAEIDQFNKWKTYLSSYQIRHCVYVSDGVCVLGGIQFYIAGNDADLKQQICSSAVHTCYSWWLKLGSSWSQEVSFGHDFPPI